MPQFIIKSRKLSSLGVILSCLTLGACRGKTISQNDRSPAIAKTQQLGGEAGEVVIDAPDDLKAAAGQLSIGEGAALNNQAVGASVGVGTELSAAGPAVNVQSSAAMGASDYSRLNIEIPYSEAGSLQLAEMFLVVAYAVKNENGETVVGIIPAAGDRPYTIANKRLRFALRGFGNYQAIRIAVEIKEEKSAVSTIVTTKSKEEVAALPALIIRDIKPIAAKRGETIKLSGDNLRKGLSALFSGIALTNIQVMNAQTASAQLPAGAKIGAGELYLLQDGAEVRKAFLYAGSDGDLPVFTADASLLCTGTRFYDSSGAVKEGTKACDKGSTANCTSAGQQNCVASGSYFAGTACAAEGSACYLPAFSTGSQPLKAINHDSLSNLTAANIKKGVVINGLTGTYPSASNLLTDADSTADLDNPTFNAKIKSSISFEWFTPEGTRQTGSGDADILANNIASGIDIFGLTGSLPAASCSTTVQATCQGDSACIWNGSACSINTWNIRVGVNLAGVTGVLKTNCKNRMNSSVFNSDLTPPGTASTTVGSTLDWWDTIDDFNNNGAFPATMVTSFSAESDCSYTNWQDITADGICDAAADDCMMKDRITGLIWSESYPLTGGGPASTGATWSAAVNMCDVLVYGGRSDWRLPTQKELTLAYVHGIRSVGYNGTGTIRGAGSTDNNDLFISDMDGTYWSASSESDFTSMAWNVNLHYGNGLSAAKTSSGRLICVAP